MSRGKRGTFSSVRPTATGPLFLLDKVISGYLQPDPKHIEIAPGVFFSVPRESFGKSTAELDRAGLLDATLFAVRGHSAVPEAAWEAARQTDAHNGFLGSVIRTADGRYHFSSNLSAHALKEVQRKTIESYTIWLVCDDSSEASSFFPFLSVCPEALKGLAGLDHDCANFLADRDFEFFAKATANEEYFGDFAKVYAQERLLQPVPQGARLRPSLLT